MSNNSFISTTKGKVVLIKGISQYNVLRLACDLIAKGFEKNGYQVVVLDSQSFIKNNDFYETLKREMEDRGLFIFSYNALYHNLRLDNDTSFYEFINYPVFGFLVDHPCYHHDRLLSTSGDNIHISCFDWHHLNYIKRYYPKHKHVNFIPHFSFKAEEFVPYENKKIDVYFPGSYKNPKSYKSSIESMPKVFADIVQTLIVQLLENKTLTLEAALRCYLSSINFEYTNEEFAELMNVVLLSDLYLRDYYRDLIVKSILDAGISLVVCGKGWEELKDVYKERLTIIGDCGLDIKENVKLISESRILINIFPSIKNGTHERVFTAMRNCCVCLSNSNKYLQDNFCDGKDIVLYDLDMIEEIPTKIRWLQNNFEKAKTIAENGYRIACNEYDEKNVARRVLDIMGLE